MRIKNRLRINAVASLLIASVIGTVLVFSLYRLNKANNSSIIAGNIITTSLERVSFRNDYIRRDSERAKAQWFDANKKIDELLKSAPEYFQKSESKKTISKMIEAQETFEEIFSAIVANRQKNSSSVGLVGLPLDVEERLLNQLNMKTYETVLWGRALQESSKQARDSALKLAAGGVFSALLVLVTAAMVNLWSMGRVITDRVKCLRDGAVAIGGGDLGHQINIKGNDEFVELSVAFNEMTARLSGSYHDLESEIEERKRVEVALQGSEERLALTASATQIGMFDLNLHSCKVLWTQAHDAIFGYAPVATTTTTTTTTTEYDDHRWSERVHPEDLPIVEEESRRCILENRPLESQYRIIWPDGSLHWVETKAVYLFDSNGNTYRMLGVVMDITARKQAEEELARTHALLETLLTQAPVGFIYLDRDLRYVLINDQLADINGLPVAAHIGQHVGDIVPTLLSTLQQVTEQILATGQPVKDHEFSGETVSAPGVTRYWNESWYPVHDDTGSIVGFGAVVEEITERKQAEEQIKKSLAEKEVMLKEIHHRVKNNLQVISSLVSLQANNLTDERMRDELNDVQDRIRSMALIHETLYQASDLAQLNFTEYATSLLRSLWRSHGTLAAKARLNLALAPVTLSIEKAVPCGLILNELASNALKHAFPNSIDGEVTVGLEHDTTTDTAYLWVRDNGVGLSPDLDWRQTSSLGLRLVQILTDQLCGSVDTGTGPGAEFRVTFPLNGLQS